MKQLVSEAIDFGLLFFVGLKIQIYYDRKFSIPSCFFFQTKRYIFGQILNLDILLICLFLLCTCRFICVKGNDWQNGIRTAIKGRKKKVILDTLIGSGRVSWMSRVQSN